MTAHAAAAQLLHVNALGTPVQSAPQPSHPSYCIAPAAGALSNRGKPAPTNPSELYEPAPNTLGALPFEMGHTPRMKCAERRAAFH